MFGHFIPRIYEIMTNFDMRYYYLTFLSALTAAFYLKGRNDPNFEDCP